MGRGRPTGQMTPARRRVLTYWRKHGPCSIGQLCRATGVERSRGKRILKALVEMGELENYSPVFKYLEAA